MKKLFLALMSLCSFSPLASNAQELNFGAHSGINISNFAEGSSRNAYDNSNKLGYEIGGDLRLIWNNGINLSSGISFSQTGGKFAALSDYLDETGKMVTEYPEINIKTLSVEIPIQIGYKITLSKNFAINPFVGAYGRWALLSIKDKVYINGEKDAIKWNCLEQFSKDSHKIEAMKRFDYGLSCGIEAFIYKHYVAGFKYKRALNSSLTQYNLKNQSYTLSVGYQF